MDKLTEMGRQHFGDISEATWRLWEATAFPFTDDEYIERQIIDEALRAIEGGDELSQ